MNNSVRQNTSIAMGLDAIFSAKKTDLAEPVLIQTHDNHTGIMQLPLHYILPSPFQARHYFSDSALSDLADSIKQHGILQPLIVRKVADNQFELLAGERRWRAASQLKLATVPAIICAVDDTTAMAFGLIENIQRENLNVIEEAKAYARLLDEFQLSHDELSEKIGKSRSHITNLLRLNRLPDSIKNDVINNEISMGHARAILTLPENQQLEIAREIVDRGLSVRQTEDFVKRIFEKKHGIHSEDKVVKLSDELKNNMIAWKKLLTAKYGAQVKINLDSESRGRVVLEVDSPETLKKLIDRMIGAVI